MAETVIKIGYTSKGAYSENTTYDRLDVVSFGHGIYASRVANNIGHAVTDPAWWDVFVDADAIDDSISDASAAAVSALTAAGAAEQIATGMLSDVKAGKTAIATALTNQGSVTDGGEALTVMAAKVQNLKLAVAGEIRDFDRCGMLGDIDLPALLKNNVRTDYPYSCGVSFFAVDLSTVTLSGADAYLCSDGFFAEGSTTHTFTDNPTIYRYIIFYFRAIDYTVPLPVSRVRQLIAWNGHPYFVTTAANKVQELISYSPDNYTDNFGQLAGTVAYISARGIAVVTAGSVTHDNSAILMLSLSALASVTGGNVVYGCAALATLALPALASVAGGTVVSNCGALATLALPALASMAGSTVVFNCNALATLALPALASVAGGYVVNGCGALATLALPALASVAGGYVVNGCGALATLALPALAIITGGNVVYGCGALATLALPALASVAGGIVVNSCNALATLALPALASVAGGYVVGSCAALATLALPALASITGGYVVNTCPALATLALPALASIGTSDAPFNAQFSALSNNCANLTSASLAALKYINSVNYNNTDGRQLFVNTLKLITLDLPSLQSANFITARNITSLALGGNKYENATDTIDVSGSYANTSLTSLTVGQGFAINLTLNGCDALTHDVLVAIIANLANQTTDVPLTLKLDSVLIALLSAGEIAVATNKNWNVII